jgi:hypothetical protein
MRPGVYLETTVISYLAARPSRDLIVAAHQAITRQWWDERRRGFALFVSQLVVDECRRGNTEAMSRRLDLLRGVTALDVSREAQTLAAALLADRAFPPTAPGDAAHVAVAATNAMRYLLTWNCAHINNAQSVERIESVCARRGYPCPVICTPEELMGDVP